MAQAPISRRQECVQLSTRSSTPAAASCTAGGSPPGRGIDLHNATPGNHPSPACPQASGACDDHPVESLARLTTAPMGPVPRHKRRSETASKQVLYPPPSLVPPPLPLRSRRHRSTHFDHRNLLGNSRLQQTGGIHTQRCSTHVWRHASILFDRVIRTSGSRTSGSTSKRLTVCRATMRAARHCSFLCHKLTAPP